MRSTYCVAIGRRGGQTVNSSHARNRARVWVYSRVTGVMVRVTVRVRVKSWGVTNSLRWLHFQVMLAH